MHKLLNYSYKLKESQINLCGNEWRYCNNDCSNCIYNHNSIYSYNSISASHTQFNNSERGGIANENKI